MLIIQIHILIAIDNNWTECKDEYQLTDLPNDGNCYQRCTNYYYIDDQNKIQCTENNICPDNNKTII